MSTAASWFGLNSSSDMTSKDAQENGGVFPFSPPFSFSLLCSFLCPGGKDSKTCVRKGHAECMITHGLGKGCLYDILRGLFFLHLPCPSPFSFLSFFFLDSLLLLPLLHLDRPFCPILLFPCQARRGYALSHLSGWLWLLRARLSLPAALVKAPPHIVFSFTHLVLSVYGFSGSGFGFAYTIHHQCFLLGGWVG